MLCAEKLDYTLKRLGSPGMRLAIFLLVVLKPASSGATCSYVDPLYELDFVDILESACGAT